MRRLLRQLLPPALAEALRRVRGEDHALRTYLRSGRVPWSRGYADYRKQVVLRAVQDAELLECFRVGGTLPPEWGVGVDERCVEWPWVLAHLAQGNGLLLDAGAGLNRDFLLDSDALGRYPIHMILLAPERYCYWDRGVSYLFHDLRDLPIRDAFYDVVVCVSTLEHIGFDNVLYGKRRPSGEDLPDDFVSAVGHFRRVLKPHGVLLFTVPFGRRQLLHTQQVFDRALLSQAIEAFGPSAEVWQTFYRYGPHGWEVSVSADCADCEYVPWIAQLPDERPAAFPVQPDNAAAARAVACVRIVKGEA